MTYGQEEHHHLFHQAKPDITARRRFISTRYMVGLTALLFIYFKANENMETKGMNILTSLVVFPVTSPLL
jgi:hypothetical protein